MKYILYVLMVGSALASIALADTFTGKPDPYNKTTTVTIPTGTYLGQDAAIQASSLTVLGNSVMRATANVQGALSTDASLTVATSATVGGGATVAGQLTVDGGLNLGHGSQVITKFLRGSTTIWGYDAGTILEGACTTDVVFSAPGVTSNSLCYLQEAETFGEKYHCEAHYTGPDQLHWECCCTDNPFCGWIAPATTQWMCFE